MQNNNAKFTFFYLLSLVSLGFFAISAGIIIFQIINKNIIDIVETYNTRYNIEALRFALSAILVSAPIYLAVTRQINKNLATGALDSQAAIRRWLTYLILLVTSFVMIGWAIGVVNNFLNGDLALKFILKSVTVLAIAGIIFSYYLYDIRRENLQEQKNKIITAYFYVACLAALAIFIAGIFFVESPKEARDRRIDTETINRMSTLANAIQQYYDENKALPENLAALDAVSTLFTKDDLLNPLTKNQFVYNVLSDKKYELCSDFLRDSMKDNTVDRYAPYPSSNWEYSAGYDCIERNVWDSPSKSEIMPSVMQ